MSVARAESALRIIRPSSAVRDEGGWLKLFVNNHLIGPSGAMFRVKMANYPVSRATIPDDKLIPGVDFLAKLIQSVVGSQLSGGIRGSQTEVRMARG